MIKRREQGVRTEYLVAKRRREREGYKWVKSAEKGIGKRSDRGKMKKADHGETCVKREETKNELITRLKKKRREYKGEEDIGMSRIKRK